MHTRAILSPKWDSAIPVIMRYDVIEIIAQSMYEAFVHDGSRPAWDEVAEADKDTWRHYAARQYERIMEMGGCVVTRR